MPLLARFLLFLLLGFVDLSLSWLLFTYQDGNATITEANPIAFRLFEQHGWFGLAILKASCSGTFLGACLILARYRKTLVDQLLWIGIYGVGGVILYSCGLTVYLGWTHTTCIQYSPPHQMTQEEREYAFKMICNRLTPELIRGNITLTSAGHSLESRCPVTLPPVAKVKQMLLANPGMEYMRCLHVIILQNVFLELHTHDPVESSYIAVRLLTEYRTCWRKPLPSKIQRLASPFQTSPTLTGSFVVPAAESAILKGD